MPKTEIDYSNTIIYKIACKNIEVKDVYVGHTTNFVQRKHCHKQSCINEKTANYNCKLYKSIRENGGWSNWKMEIIGFFNCKDHYEARLKEQEYFELLSANLNSIEPMPKPKYEEKKNKYFCKPCNIFCESKKTFNMHNNTNKHKKNSAGVQLIQNPQKNPQYFCDCCDIKTSNKKDYNRHLLTAKHQKKGKWITNDAILDNPLQEQEPSIFYCGCGKKYKYRQGLQKHKKKCQPAEKFPNFPPDTIVDKQLILELIKQNQTLIFENKEFKELLVDQSNKMFELASKPSIINTNCNNNNNKQFNLQVFLNDKCKDAMNMSDFISSLEILDDDFENIGKLGYVQGISNIFIKGFKDLDEAVRPMHCNDLKRETIYIKDNDIWNKDDNKQKIRNAIAMIAHKNLKYIPIWTDANPSSFDSTTKTNDLYMKIANQVTTCITPDDDSGINKIIRNVASRVIIEK